METTGSTKVTKIPATTTTTTSRVKLTLSLDDSIGYTEKSSSALGYSEENAHGHQLSRSPVIAVAGCHGNGLSWLPTVTITGCQGYQKEGALSPATYLATVLDDKVDGAVVSVGNAVCKGLVAFLDVPLCRQTVAIVQLQLVKGEIVLQADREREGG